MVASDDARSVSALRETLRAGPVGELVRRVRRTTKAPRAGALLLLTLSLGRLPLRGLRTSLARRLLGLQIARDAVLYRWRDLRYPAGIIIGGGSVIGFDATLDGRRGITIGRNVNLSSEVAMWTLQHDHNDPDFGTEGGPITVGDYAWISFRATILPGVRIGEGAVVAANAVVTRDVPDYAVVGGIPAKVIGQRTRDLDYSISEGGPWFV
ncbi:acyltransferase [Mumia sp. zg.B17]|uniref:acyltransferase n=1 Tax=Mumia sp. zg.B17 TaxID=2855446 RepID=UPI001C6E095E|nr:acyltransferase [Mumia sp. zg.B17]MBW9206904.1 acyltransferase [Mumia sp. zg.B17]